MKKEHEKFRYKSAQVFGNWGGPFFLELIEPLLLAKDIKMKRIDDFINREGLL